MTTSPGWDPAAAQRPVSGKKLADSLREASTRFHVYNPNECCCRLVNGVQAVESFTQVLVSLKRVGDILYLRFFVSVFSQYFGELQVLSAEAPVL